MKCPMNGECKCGEPHYRLTRYGHEILQILRLGISSEEALERLSKLKKKEGELKNDRNSGMRTRNGT